MKKVIMLSLLLGACAHTPSPEGCTRNPETGEMKCETKYPDCKEIAPDVWDCR